MSVRLWDGAAAEVLAQPGGIHATLPEQAIGDTLAFGEHREDQVRASGLVVIESLGFDGR